MHRTPFVMATLCLVLAPHIAVAQTPTQPEFGLETTGACRQLSVKNPTNAAQVPMGCVDTAANGFISKPSRLELPSSDNGSTGNISGMSVTPSASGSTNTLAKLLYGVRPADGAATPTTELASAAWVRSFGAGYANVLSCLSQAQLIDVISGAGTIDLTGALQPCLTNLGAVTVLWPAGSYQIGGTITPPEGQNQLAVGRGWNSGTVIRVLGSPSAPTFKLTGAQSVEGFAFRGSTTEQEGHSFISFEGNGGTAKDNFFFGGYVQIYLGNTAFYVQIDHNKFLGGAAYALRGISTNDSGNDFTARGNRFLAHTVDRTVSVARFTGLGSAIWTDNIVSAGQTGGPSVWIESVALRYGGWQVSNSVFEQKGDQPSFYAQGSSERPVTAIHSVNSLYTGDKGAGVLLSYTQKAKFISGGIASTSAAGAFQVQGYGSSQDINVTSVELQGDAGISPIQFAANSSGSINLISTEWSGIASIFDASASSVSLDYFVYQGGSPGANSMPFKLPAGTKVNISYGGNEYASGKLGVGTMAPGNTATVVGASQAYTAPSLGNATLQVSTGTGANTDTGLFMGANAVGETWIQSAKPGSTILPLRINGLGGAILLGKPPSGRTDVLGLPYVPAFAGTPIGTPVAQTGYAPLAVDSVNGKLCAYTGSAWKCTTLQ